MTTILKQNGKSPMTASNNFDETADFELNRGTICTSLESRRKTPALLKNSFELVSKDIQKKMETCEGQFLVAVCYEHTQESVVETISIEKPGQFVSKILGRHKRNDIVLASDFSMSLRHLLLIFALNDEGDAIVRGIDLKTEMGLLDIDDKHHESILSQGPLALRLGNSAIFILPIPQNKADIANHLPNTFEEIKWAPIIHWIPTANPEKKLGKLNRSGKKSSLSLHLDHQADLLPSKKNARGTLNFKYQDQVRHFTLTSTETRSGLLLGRYTRCQLNSLNEVLFPTTISRVHLIIISIGSQIEVIDTGSTNGITFAEKKVKQLSLSTHFPAKFAVGGVQISWSPFKSK